MLMDTRHVSDFETVLRLYLKHAHTPEEKNERMPSESSLYITRTDEADIYYPNKPNSADHVG